MVEYGCDLGFECFFEGLIILDIGCGGGLFSEFMVCFGVIVVGVDVVECNIFVVKVYVE